MEKSDRNLITSANVNSLFLVYLSDSLSEVHKMNICVEEEKSGAESEEKSGAESAGSSCPSMRSDSSKVDHLNFRDEPGPSDTT